ncbi:hypothetical protein B0H11DRAFT_2096200 [Mycena galericulata]|nr:hypothetical protein B0H11DRAFT_2096200 [Mycena galericulata]
MAAECSETYSVARCGDDKRDLLREEARRMDHRTHSFAESYYNDHRPGRLMIEEIRFLEAQGEFERLACHPSSLPPFLNSLLPHLRRCELPGYLADLHSYGNHHSYFEVLHRLIFEVMSKNRDRSEIRMILDANRVTPFMLKTIPYSANYNLGRKDQFTIACAGIRQLITQGLTAVMVEHDRSGNNAVGFFQEYHRETVARSTYNFKNEFPSSFVSISRHQPRLPYPEDIKVDVNAWHPFIHPFEHRYLEASAKVFRSSPRPEARELADIISRLLAYRFHNQAEMTHIFTTGILGTVGKIDMFKDDFDYTPDRYDGY